MPVELIKGNTAIAEAALRAGLDAYFGYPITPQTELLEHLARRMPELGRVFLGGGFRRDQGFYQGTILIEQLADGGGDVFGLNGVEAGQAAEIEEWVHGVHDGYER